MAERDEEIAELPLDSAGARLRRAREAAGLSLADIAARTKIAERHLGSIEAGKFGEMASRAYAVGFSRSYARTLGLDEKEIAAAVGNELDGIEAGSDRHSTMQFEPGDPARVPGSRLAWIAALAALAVIAALFLMWRSFVAPAASLPDLTSDTPTASEPAVAGTSAPAQPAQGPVVFTALAPGIWVKFYDAAGTQLLQKELALGETYTVPAQAAGPMIWTARPDSLQVSVGGRVLPKLSEQQVTMKDVPVDAAALLTRAAPGAPAALPSAAQPAPAGAAPASPGPASPAASRGNAPVRASPAPALRVAAQQAVPAPVAAGPAALPAQAQATAPAPAATASTPQSSTVSQ